MAPTTLPFLPHYPESLTSGQAHAILPQVLVATCSGCRRLLDPYEMVAIHRSCGLCACYPCLTKFIDESKRRNQAPICGGCNHPLTEVCQVPKAAAGISETTLDDDRQPVPRVIKGALEIEVEGKPCLYLRAANVAIALPEGYATAHAVAQAELEHAKVRKERDEFQVQGTTLVAHYNWLEEKYDTLGDDFQRLWSSLQQWQINQFNGFSGNNNNSQGGNNQGGNKQENQQQGGQNGRNGGNKNNNNINSQGRGRNRGGRSRSPPAYTRGNWNSNKNRRNS